MKREIEESEGKKIKLNNKHDAIGIMSCGCEVAFDDLIESKSNKKKFCPKHKNGELLSKKFKCIVCGEYFDTVKRTCAASYCPVCKYAKKINDNRKISKDRRAIRQEMNGYSAKYLEASVHMRHCIERSKCLKTCNAKCLPCLDCKHYDDPDMMYSFK